MGKTRGVGVGVVGSGGGGEGVVGGTQGIPLSVSVQ